MRVLYVINNLKVGGAERYVLDVCRALERESVDIQLLSLGSEYGFKDVPPVPTTTLTITKTTRNPGVLGEIVRCIRSARPNVVHSHLRYADTVAQVLGPALGVPVVSTIHGEVEWPRHHRSMLTRFEDFAVRRATRVVAVSRSVRAYVVSQRGVDPSRVVVMPCGVVLDPFLDRIVDRAAVRARLGLRSDSIVFTCAAALRPEKRHDLLIERFLLLRRFSPVPVEMLLMGASGTIVEDVRNRVAAVGEGGGVVLHRGDREKVADTLAASDVFVMHSEREGASVAVVEAMASGLPILVPDLPHFTDQVRDEQEGLLFSFHDPASFVAQASRLAANPALRRTLGDKGRTRAQTEFAMPAHARALVALYADILRKRAPFGRSDG